MQSAGSPPDSADNLAAGIAKAVDLHRTGHLAEAEAAYRAILRTHPDHSGVLHNLGVIAAQRGEHLAALDLFERALAVRPDYPDALANKAGVLQARGRFDLAIDAYDGAIALRPGHPATIAGKADALRRSGRLADAETCYRQALALNPLFYDAHRDLGLTLLALDRRAETLAQFRRTMALRRDTPPIDPGHYSFHFASRMKIRHDIAQFRYLAAQAIHAARFKALADAYESVDRDMAWPADDSRLVPLPDLLRHRIEASYNRPVHLVDAPELPGGAVNPGLDAAAISRRYVDTAPGVAYFDDLLTPDALSSLRRFLLGSTIWFDFAHIGGFLAAYLEDGMACPLLLQIAADLRRRFPDILRDHPLTQAWAFKCLHGERGIDVHADAAAVSLNFWITPDDANLAPGHGGLIVYRAQPPAGWQVKAYDADVGPIREFLRVHGGDRVTVPYGLNRAVFFNSELFHESDEVRFHAAYENHRINITMLFGERRY